MYGISNEIDSSLILVMAYSAIVEPPSRGTALGLGPDTANDTVTGIDNVCLNKRTSEARVHLNYNTVSTLIAKYKD